MPVAARELLFRITGDAEGFNKAINEANESIDAFEKKTKAFNQVFGEAAKISVAATTAIAAIGAVTAKLAIDFNKGFGSVQTLIPGAAERIKELQQNVLELSPAVGKTTKDLTDGLYQIISAYGDSSEAAQQLELSAKAAAAGGATTLQSIDLLSAVTKGYGDTTYEAQRKVSDLAFVTVKLGQTTFPDLASSMQRVTALSQSLGISQEEMFAVFSSGTGVIGGASEVSTKLAATYNELQKPQERLLSAFKALGVASGSELIQKFGGLQGALNALKGQAEASGIPISNLFGSIEAGQLALYATGAGAKKFANDLTAMGEAAGATDEAFDAATTGGVNRFGFQLEQAKLSAQAFGIKLGQELVPHIQELAQPCFSLAELLKNLNETTLKNIVSIGKIVIAFTGTAASVYGLIRGLSALTKIMNVMKAAFHANPFGIAVIAIVTLGTAVSELTRRFEEQKKIRRELELEHIKNKATLIDETKKTSTLIATYEELSAKTKLTAEEKLKLKRASEELKTLYPHLTSAYDDNTKALKFNREELKKLNEEQLASLKTEQMRIQITIAKTSEQVGAYTQKLAALKTKKTELDKLPAQEHTGLIGGVIGNRAALEASKEIDEVENLIKRLQENIAAYQGVNAQLAQAVAEKETEQEQLADPQQTSAPEKSKKNGGKTHAERLKELDDEWNAEKQIISARKTTEQERAAAILALDSKYYADRNELLDAFVKENLMQGQTLAKAQREAVGRAGEAIVTEHEKTNSEIERLAHEQHAIELAALATVAEETETLLKKELELKKNLGQLAGDTDAEQEKTYYLELRKGLLQKQNELLGQYVQLSSSGKKEDKEKAAAIRQEMDELGEKAKEVGAKLEHPFVKAAKKIAESIKQIGGALTETVSGIAGIATDIIGLKEEQNKQKTAERLAEIDRERNKTLLALDSELSDLREAKHSEDAEREEARREEEYQKTIAAHDRTLAELQGTFEAETNIEKIRALEKQLEEERRKKAEEIARKKEEDAKKKRDKEARLAEIELMNARASAEHAFAVTRIQTENASGEAGARAAQEAAKWKKAETIISLSVKAAEQIALAAIDAATPGMQWNVGFRAAAAALALAQAGVTAAQPLPPGYTSQPVPPAPRPIKFQHGAIVMPSSGGTGITLPGNIPGIVAEAGIPEMILPLSIPNMENMFRAIGLSTNASASLTYAPNYTIALEGGAYTDDVGEKLLAVLRQHGREVNSLLEEERRKWFVE